MDKFTVKGNEELDDDSHKTSSEGSFEATFVSLSHLLSFYLYKSQFRAFLSRYVA